MEGGTCAALMQINRGRMTRELVCGVKVGQHAVTARERLHDEHFGHAARRVGGVVIVDCVDDE